MTFLLFAPASTKWLDDVKTENPERTAQVDFVSFIVQSYILRYSFALGSDILWSSCFESYGPKDTR